MFSSTLSKDNLTNTFRTLSQKRKSGYLRIERVSGATDVYFSLGKIVAVRRGQAALEHEAVNRLSAACPDIAGELKTLLSKSRSIEELFEKIQSKESQQQFLQAKEAAERDWIAEVWESETGEFDFHPSPIDAVSKLALAISPAQILLDLVELEDLRARFTASFAAASAPHYLKRKAANPGNLSPEEGRIWQLLEDERSLEDLKSLCFLSEIDFYQAILALLNREQIALCAVSGEPVPEDISLPEKSEQAALPEELESAEELDDDLPLADANISLQWRALVRDEEDVEDLLFHPEAKDAEPAAEVVSIVKAELAESASPTELSRPVLSRPVSDEPKEPVPAEPPPTPEWKQISGSKPEEPPARETAVASARAPAQAPAKASPALKREFPQAAFVGAKTVQLSSGKDLSLTFFLLILLAAVMLAAPKQIDRWFLALEQLHTDKPDR